MSNLTSDLGAPQSSASVTQGASDLSSNVIAGGLGVLAQSIGGLATQWQKGAQLKRQQIEDQRATIKFNQEQNVYNQGQQDRQAQDLVTRTANAANQGLYNPTPVGVPSPVDFSTVTPDMTINAGLDAPAASTVPTEISPAAGAAIAAGASKLNSFTTAAAQGKMSPVAVQSQADMLLNTLLTQHPELNGGVIADQLKKLGVDNGLFRMIKSDQDRYSDQQARVKAQQDAYYAEGAKWLNPEEAKTLSPEEIMDRGRSHLLTEANQKAQEAVLDLQSKTQSGQMQQYNDNKVIYSDQVQQIKHDALTSYLKPYLDQFVQFNSLAPDGGADPNYELQRAKLVPLVQQKFEIALAKTAASITDPTARNAFMDSERKQFQGTYLAPMQSRDPAIGAAIKGIQQYLGLKSELAFPMFAQMQAAGIRAGDITPLLEGLPPAVKKSLSTEYQGIFTQHLDPQAGKIVLNHMIGVLRGTDSLTNVNDPKIRQALVSTSANMVMTQAQAVAAGKGDAQSYSGTLKTLVLASASVNRSNPDNISRALGSIATNSNIAAINKLLSDPGTHPDGVELATGTRASAAHLVANSTAAMRGQLKSEAFQTVRFNQDTGQYQILFNDRAWALHVKQAQGSTGLREGTGIGPSNFVPTKPQPSSTLSNLVNSTNQGLNFLSHTSAWDKTAPESGESARDIANYYATGTQTPRMQAAAAKAAGATKQAGDALTIGKTLEQSLTRHLNDDIPTGAENSDITGPEGTGKNPRSSASGVGQFTDATWVDTLRKHAPDLIQNKSIPDIIAMKGNQELARRAVGWYRGDNAVHLGNNGIVPTAQNTALAHFAGPEGAVSLLKADPNTPAESVLGSRAINANPQLKGKTVGEVIDWAHRFYHA